MNPDKIIESILEDAPAAAALDRHMFSGGDPEAVPGGLSSEPDILADRMHNQGLFDNAASANDVVTLFYESFPVETYLIRIHEDPEEIGNTHLQPSFYEAIVFMANENPDTQIDIYTNDEQRWITHLGTAPTNVNIIGEEEREESPEVDADPGFSPVSEAEVPLEAPPEEGLGGGPSEDMKDLELRVYQDAEEPTSFDIYL